jgi:hypothetical protein
LGEWVGALYENFKAQSVLSQKSANNPCRKDAYVERAIGHGEQELNFQARRRTDLFLAASDLTSPDSPQLAGQ